MKKILGLSVLALACAPAFAQTITSYDIEQAARSGFGGWGHTYGGTIVDTGNFFANGNPFTRADYSGGSGTLNDGSDGVGAGDTQLFANNNDAQPRITLHLDNTYNISSLTLFSFDSGNIIPGSIASCSVTIGGQTEHFTTIEQTTNDEFIDLSNSPLSRICTDTVILTRFVHDGNNGGVLNEMFCIGEIRLRGQTCSGCPSDFTATKSGSCPTSNMVSWSGAPANSVVRVLYTTNNGGGGNIPSGPCAGTRLCIGLGGITLHAQRFNSPGGSGNTPNFAAPCGLNIQLITETTCKTSNKVTL